MSEQLLCAGHHIILVKRHHPTVLKVGSIFSLFRCGNRGSEQLRELPKKEGIGETHRTRKTEAEASMASFGGAAGGGSFHPGQLRDARAPGAFTAVLGQLMRNGIPMWWEGRGSSVLPFSPSDSMVLLSSPSCPYTR